MSAGAAIRQARPKPDQQPSRKHPRDFADVPQPDGMVEHPYRPRRRPPATEHGGHEPAQDEPYDKRQSPAPVLCQRAATEVRLVDDDAADILETAGDAEAPTADGDQR